MRRGDLRGPLLVCLLCSQGKTACSTPPPSTGKIRKKTNVWEMLDTLFNAFNWQGKHYVRVCIEQKTLINSVQQPRTYLSVPACWTHLFQYICMQQLGGEMCNGRNLHKTVVSEELKHSHALRATFPLK